MKTVFQLFTAVVLSVALFSSCNDPGGVQQKITGKPGELVIVMSKEAWDNAPGDLMRKTLAQQHICLLADEPVFDLFEVPHDAFKSILKSTRNIIQVSISSNNDKEGVEFKDNIWAYPQATVQILAKSNENFEKLFNENKNKIMSYFLLAERKRLMDTYKRLHEKSIYNTLSEKFDVTLKLPPGFIQASSKDKLMWFRYDTPDITQGIVVFEYPYTSDSAFTARYQTMMIDSILKYNVQGSLKNSYMQIEKRVDQVINSLKHNKNYACEMRGLWMTENDFMGGPYIALSELDLLHKRVITVYGFLYAPNKDKRNLLRQVEAMMYSLSFNKQEDMDKLNKQMSLGD